MKAAESGHTGSTATWSRLEMYSDFWRTTSCRDGNPANPRATPCAERRSAGISRRRSADWRAQAGRTTVRGFRVYGAAPTCTTWVMEQVTWVMLAAAAPMLNALKVMLAAG